MMTPVDDDEGAQATIGLPGAGTPVGERAGTLSGTRVGPYLLVSLLGRGGMGEVYVARQDEPVRRTVALKVLRARHLDTRRLTHFEVERQLLAQMRHPAIAQIFDAGTTADGRPYSAMELIDGLPVTGYCARERLPLRARLELFARICEGVQHAHQKGVVHRDLKPGNILVAKVDGRALPKVIDFGIASITSGGNSDAGDALGTPAYMSPEQAGSAHDIDTRSDVYSLGVLLHELLCGHRPAPGAAPPFRPSSRYAVLPRDEQVRVAGELGTDRATLRAALVTELDWVVAKATAPDRTQRYGSVMELVDDLERFLDGRPVGAVPDRRAYRWGKYVRRHRGALAVASVVFAALLGGLGLSLYGLGQARTQQALAEERARQLEAVSGFQQAMLEEIDIEAMGLGLGGALRDGVARTVPEERDALERILGKADLVDIARELVAASILERAEQAIVRDFGDQPLLAADLREAVGRVQGALGMHAAAAAAFADVAGLRAAALGPRSAPVLAAQRERLAQLRHGDAREEALDLIRSVESDFAALAVDDPERLAFERERAWLETDVSGDQQALRTRLEALSERSRAALGERHPTTLQLLGDYAQALGRIGERRQAKELVERLLPLHVETLGDAHPSTSDLKRRVAILRIQTDDFDGAVSMQRQIVADMVRRQGAEHPRTLSARGALAAMLSDADQNGEAVPLALEVLAANGRVLGPEHPQTMRSRLNASSLLARTGRFDEALAMQLEVIEERTRLLGPTHPDTLYMLVNRPATLHQAGRTADGLALMDRVLPQVRQALGDAHPTTLMAMSIRAMIARESGDLPLEIATLREALSWQLAAQRDGELDTVKTAWLLAGALQEAGQGGTEADALLRTHVQPLLDAPPGSLSPGHRRLADHIREESGS